MIENIIHVFPHEISLDIMRYVGLPINPTAKIIQEKYNEYIFFNNLWEYTLISTFAEYYFIMIDLPDLIENYDE